MICLLSDIIVNIMRAQPITTNQMRIFAKIPGFIKNKIFSYFKSKDENVMPADIQVQRPRSRYLKPQGYAYKTLEIIEIINKLENFGVNEQQLVDFLEEIPFGSNYLISVRGSGKKIERIIEGVYDNNFPPFSEHCIGDHTQIIGLTNKCVISLSKSQYKQLHDMMKQHYL